MHIFPWGLLLLFLLPMQSHGTHVCNDIEKKSLPPPHKKVAHKETQLSDSQIKKATDLEYEPFVDGIIGILTIFHFREEERSHCSTEKEIQSAFSQLQSHAPLYGIIVDLRHSKGNSLQQIAKIANLFTPKKVLYIANSSFKIPNLIDKFYTFSHCPIIVLISNLSPPSAEILAYILRHNGRAFVIGDDKNKITTTSSSSILSIPSSTKDRSIPSIRHIESSMLKSPLSNLQMDIIVPSIYAHKKNAPHSPPFFKTNNTSHCSMQFCSIFLPHPSVSSRRNSIVAQLQKNSRHRLSQNKNFALFLKRLNQEEIPIAEKSQFCGSSDLQKIEALHIMKDIIFLSW